MIFALTLKDNYSNYKNKKFISSFKININVSLFCKYIPFSICKKCSVQLWLISLRIINARPFIHFGLIL